MIFIVVFPWFIFGFVAIRELSGYQAIVLKYLIQKFPEDFRDFPMVEGVYSLASKIRIEYPQLENLPMIKYLNMLEFSYISLVILPMIVILASGILFILRIIGKKFGMGIYVGVGISYIIFTIGYALYTRSKVSQIKRRMGTS